jgi:hypothetical protein
LFGTAAPIAQVDEDIAQLFFVGACGCALPPELVEQHLPRIGGVLLPQIGAGGAAFELLHLLRIGFINCRHGFFAAVTAIYAAFEQVGVKRGSVWPAF